MAVSNFTSGRFHSPATARAHSDFPHPCTPRMITPCGASKPNSRAASSHEPRLRASQRLRLSIPPTPAKASPASTNSSISERRSKTLLGFVHILRNLWAQSIPRNQRLRKRTLCFFFGKATQAFHYCVIALGIKPPLQSVILGNSRDSFIDDLPQASPVGQG